MEDDQHQWWKGLKIEKIVLSEKDYELFLKTLENPPAPNEKLRQLLKKQNWRNEK